MREDGVKAATRLPGAQGDGKADAIRRIGALCYGETTSTICVSHAWLRLSQWGVTTGNHSEAKLYQAGAHHVLTTLEAFPSLLDQIMRNL